jgi:hypothetical protein
MNASTIMFVAVAAAAVGRWSHNQPTASVKTVVESAFAIIVIALLDQGKTEVVAKGFAWIFLAAVLLSNNSPLTGLAKTFGKPTGTRIV